MSLHRSLGYLYKEHGAVPVKAPGPVSKPPMSTAEEESISILLHVPLICSYQKLLSSLKVSPLSSEWVGILEQSHGDTIVAQGTGTL